MRPAIPGLLLGAALAAVALAVNQAVPLLSSLLVAIVLGVVVRNLRLVPAAAEPGLRVLGKPVLRLGVVLLGLRLSLPQVLELGWGVVAVIVVTVGAVLAAGLTLGYAFGLDRTTALLVTTGTAICGAAAVAAMSAVLRDRGEEDRERATATAVATVTVLGTVALVALPPLAGLLGLGARAAGAWIGTSVHEVGQVVAAAGILGVPVLDVAVVTKLGRVVLLAPLVAAVGIVEARRAARPAAVPAGGGPVPGSPADGRGGRTAVVPLFVVGFLAMVLVRSVLPLSEGLLVGAETAATALLTAAMVAVGAGVDVRALLRSGGPALGLAAALSGLAALVSLAGLAALT